MALDPTIALQTKPITGPSIGDYMQMAGTAQNIKQSQAATSNLEAANPGIQATSTKLQQDAQAAVQDQTANNELIKMAGSGKYTTTDPTTGNATIDYPKMYGDLASKGYTQQALKMAGAKGDADYKIAAAQGAAAVAAGNQTDAASKAQDFFNHQVQVAANIIDQSKTPQELKGKALSDMVTRMAAHYPDAAQFSPYVQMPSPSAAPTNGAPGQMTPTGTGPASVPGQPNPGGPQPGQQPTPKLVNPNMSSADVKAIADGSLDPLTRANLQISQSQLSLAQLQASPGYKAAMSGIVDSGTAADAQRKSAENGAYVSSLKNGVDAKIDGSKYGIIGSWTQAAWNKAVEQGGSYATLQGALDKYNQRNGTQYSIPGNGVDYVKSLMRNEANVATDLSHAYDRIGKPSVPEGAPTPAGTSTPKALQAAPAPAPIQAPGAAKVRMTVNGRNFAIPENMLDDFMKAHPTATKIGG